MAGIPRIIEPDPDGRLTMHWYTIDRPGTVLLDSWVVPPDVPIVDVVMSWHWPVHLLTVNERSMLVVYGADGILRGSLMGSRLDGTSSVVIESGWRDHDSR